MIARKSTVTSAVLFLAGSAFAAGPVVHRDLAYVEPKNVRQTLDVYAPADGENHPVVVWIHGGGWEIGSKEEGAGAKPRAFVEKGCVFVAVNYRFFPAASIREITGDVARAIRWANQNARRYRGDPDSIFVMGYSAGAQLAALVCTDERYLAAEGMTLKSIRGCVPMDGDTYDVALQVALTEANQTRPPYDSHRRKFGHEADLRDLSAVNHVAPGKGIPPFLLLHTADFPQSRTGVHAHLLAFMLIAKSKVPARVFAVPGKTHATIDADLGLPGDPSTPEVFALIDRGMKAAR